ncbi:MAG: hypothetical protein KDD63_22570, partial [Bacteroidetes bacterium]|nr:hypothetical protein [Bacteroidota bacterium]
MIKILRCLGVFVGVVLFVSFSAAQKIHLSFHQLTLREGLSDDTNAFIYNDSRGFVWISSVNGLNRFDGQTVKVYKADPGSAHSLLGNIITSSFFEEKNGDLWFTTYEGLHRYNRAHDHFDAFRLKDDSGKMITEDYYAFHLDNEKKLWVRTGVGSTGRLHWFDTKSQKDSIINPLDGQRCDVIPDASGKITGIISTLFFRKNGFEITWLYPEVEKETFGQTTSVHSTLSGKSRNAWVESDTLIWVVMENQLLAFNPLTKKSKAWSSFESVSAPSLTLADLWSLAPYGDRFLLVSSTSQGVFVFDRNSREFIQRLASGLPPPDHLPFSGVYDLYLDDQQNLWLSSWQRGIVYGNLKKAKFPILLPHNTSVFSIYETPDGNRWCGTSNGIYIYDKDRKLVHSPTSVNKNNQFENTLEFLFQGNSGKMWALARRNVLVWIPEKSVFQTQRSLSLRPQSVYQTQAGQTLIAASEGIFSVKENKETLEAIPFSILGDLQSHSFTRIFEDQKKCLFLAENRNNLIILEKKGDQYALRKRSQ